MDIPFDCRQDDFFLLYSFFRASPCHFDRLKSGLRRLCEALDIPLSDVVAFGDSFNDASMLEAAGTGYIMSTASPELLARFPHHCPNVADVLREIK